jgi:hypothetical protein
MVVTTRVRLDKIASSTRNAGLSDEVILGDEIVAAEGYVLAVRILAEKSSYNTLEDLSGRMVELRAGDVLAGTLGSRRALRGYAGDVPSTISVGDTIDVLNLGGILGRCTSVNPDIGPPFRAEVLGAVLSFPALGDRIGRPAHIRDRAVPPAEVLQCRVPVVYVAGTCMNSGKTVAATELVRGLSRLFNKLVEPLGARPEVIVAELGDGILGEYGVQDILRAPDLAALGAAWVMAAPDPVGCWGARELMRDEYGLAITVITGPATDNSVGRDYITAALGLPAHNARRDAEQLVARVRDALDCWNAAHGGPA